MGWQPRHVASGQPARGGSGESQAAAGKTFSFYAAWHSALKYLLLHYGLRVERKKTGKRERGPLLSLQV